MQHGFTFAFNEKIKQADAEEHPIAEVFEVRWGGRRGLVGRWMGGIFYLMSVLKASAMVGRLTEVKGVVYCTSALLLICATHTRTLY